MPNRIRELREDNDLRQADVSSATGIDQRTLSNYETGKTNPDSYAIIKLAQFFNVTTDYLLGIKHNKQNEIDEMLSSINEINKKLEVLKNNILHL